jgi:hypothetical protein
MKGTDLHPAFHDLSVFYGDIHNHCGVSYGKGSLEDAFRNARLQLSFASVTVHAAWPDLPTDQPNLNYLVDYHRAGFQKALANWPHYQEITEAQNQDGTFVTFPSFEWHSMQYGDHCVYFKEPAPARIIQAADLPAMRAQLRAMNVPALLIPHHIGYRAGYRGINWSAFTDEFSPVAEIFSFHGLAESSEGVYPYLHSMGPRNGHSTAQYGWAQGHVFGVVGSTDHHNAFPGSYGYGRMGVWAEALTRDAIWDAIAQRRTYALTGDCIALAFSLNEQVIGAICPSDDERWIEVAVRGGDALDYVDVLRNNQIIHRQSLLSPPAENGPYRVYLELGWGEEPSDTHWDADVRIVNGRLLNIEPRFRGYGPTANPPESDLAFTRLYQEDAQHVHFETRTRQNPSLHTPATEGISLEIDGDSGTRLNACFNGLPVELSMADLLAGTCTFHLGGFVSPAICFHRAVAEAQYATRFAFLDRRQSDGRDWYYVRVRQRNSQWAWSSPIWIGEPRAGSSFHPSGLVR